MSRPCLPLLLISIVQNMLPIIVSDRNTFGMYMVSSYGKGWSYRKHFKLKPNLARFMVRLG